MKEKRMNVNKALKKLSREENLTFIHTYRPFQDENPDLYAVDGLHLSPKGVHALHTYFEGVFTWLTGKLK